LVKGEHVDIKFREGHGAGSLTGFDHTTRGKMLYQDPLKTAVIKYITLQILLSFIFGLLFSLIIVAFYSSHQEFWKTLLIALGFSGLAYLVFISIYSFFNKYIQFRYTVFQNGFIFPIKLRGTTWSNYISYNDIEDVGFSNYGNSAILKMKNTRFLIITTNEGIVPYLLIVHEVAKRLEKRELPDLTLVERFATIKNAREEKELQIELKNKNFKWREPPREW
jgi:hypothetical protein